MNNTPSKIQPAIVQKIHDRLEMLYGDGSRPTLNRIVTLLESYQRNLPGNSRTCWDQRDVVLITYGDQVRQSGHTSLATLREFLLSQRVDDLVSAIHILPFCPFSSDDGFSVIDYRDVASEMGDWADVRDLGKSFELMFDLVLNHASSQSHWFQEYLAGHMPYDEYFIEADPSTDLTSVTRPRSSPVLTAFDTRGGKRYLWTTFSEDQLDLNFANPDVLCEMLDILLFYIQHGARIIRLDAIAYLWKQVGTPCVHLPQTHQVVKLFRDVVTAVAPHVWLLTETNVPHAENISYFGDADEAHMVYQFPLPPLLLYTMLTGNAQTFVNWLAEARDVATCTTFFNFTASHDGIGVRPLEGLIAPKQIDWLVEQVKLRGGLVTTRRRSDGTDAAYELNISYFSALANPDQPDSVSHVRRFITSQAIMLSLRGMPAIYFHSLFGTENDSASAQSSGQPRRINRRKFNLSDLGRRLNDRDSIPARVFDAYQRLLSVRRRQPAFHPDAEQTVLQTHNTWLIAFLRTSLDRKQKILTLANVSDQKQSLDLNRMCDVRFEHDLLSSELVPSSQNITMGAGSVVWLEAS